MAIKFDVTATNKDFIAKMREVQDSVHNTKSAIESDGASIEAVFSKLAQGAAALGVSTGLYEFAKQTANVRGEFQKLEVAFTTLLKSKAEADDLMKQMVRTAATTPFDLKGVAAGAKSLMAYGVEADKVNDKLIQLGNLAAGLGLDLGYITTLYGTTVSKDHMDTMDLKQFKGQGIAIDQAIADVMQVDVEKVKSLISSGKITGEIVDAAIQNMTTGQGQFAGLMEAQSKTIAGQISNIEDAIDSMFNEIGKSTEGIISGALDAVGFLVENWQEVAKAIGAAVSAYGAYKAVLMTQDAMTNVMAAMQYKEESDALIALTAQLEEYAAVKADVDAEESYSNALDSTKMTDEQKEKIIELRQAYLDKAEAVKEAADLNVQALTDELQANEETVKSAQEKVNSALDAVQAAKETGDAVEIETAMREANTAAIELNEAVQVRDNTAKELSIAVDKQKAASEALDTAATTTNTVATTANATALGFLKAALLQAQAALERLWATMMANPLALLAAGVVAVGYAVYELCTYETDAEKAARELKEASEELDATITSEQANIDRLFNALRYAKEGSDEYKRAKDAIIAGYGKYLNGLSQEIQKLYDVEAAYRAVSAAARQAAIDRAIAMQMEKAQTSFAEGLTKNGKALREQLEKKLGVDRGSQYYERYLAAMNSGNSAEAQQVRSEMFKAYMKATGDTGVNATLAKLVSNVTDTYTTYNEAVNGIKANLGQTNKMNYGNMTDSQLKASLDAAKKASGNFAANGRKQVVQVAGQWYTASTNDEINALINGLANEISARNKKNGPTEAAVLADYRKRISEANNDDARATLIKELRESRSTATDGSDAKKQYDQMLSQLEKAQAANAHQSPTKGRKGKKTDAAKQAKKIADQAARQLREMADYKAAMEKNEFQMIRLMEDFEMKTQDAIIEQMAEGFEKEEAQREFQHKKALQTIIRNAEDEKRALVDAAEQLYYKDPKNKKNVFDREAYIASEEYKKQIELIDALSKAQAAAENVSYERAVKKMLEEAAELYKGYYTTRLRALEKFNKDYERMVAAGASRADLAEARKQNDKLIQQIDIDEAMEMDGFESWVETLTLKTSAELEAMLQLAQSQLLGLQASAAESGTQFDDIQGSVARTRGEIAKLQQTLKERKRRNPNDPDKKVKAATDSNRLQKAQNDWKNIQDIINGCTSAVVSLGDEIGGTFGEIASEVGELGNSTVSFINALQEYQKAKEAFDKAQTAANKMAKASSIIGLAMVALQFTMQGISKLIKAHDDRLEKKIKEAEKELKVLEDDYEDLGDLADKLFGDEAAEKIRQQNSNIEQQIALIEKQKELETRKKKTDEDQLDKYDDKMSDLRKKMADNEIQAKNAIFGSDVQSAVEDFRSAITGAWDDSTNSAASAKKAVLGMMRQMVYGAMNTSIQAPMNALRDKMLDYWENDSDFTDEEINDLMADTDIITDKFAKKFEPLYNRLSDKADEFEGTHGSYQTMSQETGSELNGRAAQIQMAVQSLQNNAIQYVEYLNSISSGIGNANSLLSNLVDLTAIGNTHLEEMLSANARYHRAVGLELASIRKTINAKL